MPRKIPERIADIGVCAGLIGIVWFVFGQTFRFPFINYDDPDYIYEVPEIRTGLTWHGIKWAFTHWPAPNWFPLQNISHMLEFQIYGFNPGAFHLTNVLLHAVAAILLFVVLRKMSAFSDDADTLWRSAFVAAVFAVHPLRVESVAWVEERKDVLSGVFFMLTLLAYLYYSRKPGIGRYLLMSVLFVFGLLSKSMLVTVPVVLLLLDYWPLRRMRKEGTAPGSNAWPRLVGEKIPLFLLAAAAAFLNAGGIASAHAAVDQLALPARIGNALLSYIIYIWQMIWPAKLALIYPYPQSGLPLWQPIFATAALVAITILAFALRKSYPHILVGWLWYILMLLPVIGIIQITPAAHADRYTYLPQIGLYLGLTWSFADIFSKSRRRIPIATAVAIVVITALATAARAQTSYWQDSERLWEHTIAVTRDNYLAHSSLADLLMRRGRREEAIVHSEEALRIRPDDADAQNNLGLALLQKGDLAGAFSHLQKAVEVNPGNMNAEVNLAWILATSPDSAARDGAKAVALAEDVARRAGHPNAIVLRTLAASYAETGRFEDAIHTAEQAIQVARATGNDGLAQDIEGHLARYHLKQPLRMGQ